MKRTLILVVMALAFPLGAASADTPAASRSIAAQGDDDCARARKAGRICELIIEGDEVGGERITPNGEQLTGRVDTVFTNLIRVRASFRDLIVKSADNL